jgi:hypothetical protein
MKWLGAVVTTLTVMYASHAMAVTQTALVWCDACTEAQKQTAARNQTPDQVVYVGDLSARNVRAYYVWLESDDSHTPPVRVKHADPTALQAPYQSAAGALIDFYFASPVGFKKQVTFNYPDQNTNVYDVVISGPDQNNLTDWVSRQSYSVSVEIRDRLVNVGSIFHISDASRIPTVEFTIGFTDGSYIDVQVDLSATNPRYKVVANSGRDSHNNNVLSTPSSAPQKFNFSSPGNVSDAADWLRQMGYLGYSGGGGGGGVWVCTMKGGGSEPVTYKCAKGV